MPRYEYQGFTAQGRSTKGIIEAGNKQAALSQLQRQQIYPTQLQEEQQQQRRRSFRWSRNQRLGSRELAVITRQLATLVGAGLTLDRALESVAQPLGADSAKGRLLHRIRQQILQGASFQEALAEQGNCFPDLYQQLVAVGENSGTLEQALQRLADYLEERARLQSRLSGALAYPLLMLVVGSGILIFLVSAVVPKVSRMLTELGQELPLPTRLLIASSDFLQAHGAWLLLLAGGLCIGTFLLLRRPGWQWRWHRRQLQLPLWGPLYRRIASARFCRTLGTLLQGGVPLLKALAICANLLENRVLRQSVVEAAEDVEEGSAIGSALAQQNTFPDLVTQMLTIGEQSGELEGLLLRVAAAYEQEVETRLNTALTLLEPLMILFMGSAVGFIVLAVLLPIFQASQGF